jgi:hypothetical protein
MNHKLKEILERVESWPAEAQAELVEVALEIEAGATGAYQPTAEELAAIDEADRSGVATETEVAEAFARYRKA